MSILSADRSRDPEPLLVKPADAGHLLGCGRTRIYKLLASGQLDSFSDGRSRKITIESTTATSSGDLPSEACHERRR